MRTREWYTTKLIDDVCTKKTIIYIYYHEHDDKYG